MSLFKRAPLPIPKWLKDSLYFLFQHPLLLFFGVLILSCLAYVMNYFLPSILHIVMVFFIYELMELMLTVYVVYYFNNKSINMANAGLLVLYKSAIRNFRLFVQLANEHYSLWMIILAVSIANFNTLLKPTSDGLMFNVYIFSFFLINLFVYKLYEQRPKDNLILSFYYSAKVCDVVNGCPSDHSDTLNSCYKLYQSHNREINVFNLIGLFVISIFIVVNISLMFTIKHLTILYPPFMIIGILSNVVLLVFWIMKVIYTLHLLGINYDKQEETENAFDLTKQMQGQGA